jgi:transposase-like protein
MAFAACKCVHQTQDQFHGKGIRVVNEVKKADPKDIQRYRCTVCGTIHDKTVTPLNRSV